MTSVPKRFVSVAASVVALSLGCGGARLQWRPSLASQVPDSTPVRAIVRPGEPPISGLAVGWNGAPPRIATARGDTVAIPVGSTLQVRLREKAGHATAGSVVGWLVGVGVMYATCAPPKRYCGEENPLPLLSLGLGALIGAKIKTYEWVRVQSDVPRAHPGELDSFCIRDRTATFSCSSLHRE